MNKLPRIARKKSKTGIYHVVMRGINRQDIFGNEEDYQRYLQTLEKVKKKSDCEILGYCLMSNHLHLLVKEKSEEIGQIMKRLGTSYASWYNWKYERVGHVFQDRYKSECVENDKYLLTVIRYIHNNPVKARIVVKPEQYRWSSYLAYIGGKEYPVGLIQTTVIFDLFSEDKNVATVKFRQYSQQENDDKCLEDEVTIRSSDEEIRLEVQKILKGKSIADLQQMSKIERNYFLQQAKKIKGSSIRQIARITGIGYNIIIRA